MKGAGSGSRFPGRPISLRLWIMSARLSMPLYLARAAQEEGREEWLDTLPTTIGELESRWSLTAGMPFQPGGRTAWVAPVSGRADVDLVIKVVWRHDGSLHEADGLRVWDGDGAVHLYAVDELPEATGLLLERCRPGTPLAHRPELEQDVVVANLLRRLWRLPPAEHPFRPLEVMCNQWADEFAGEEAAGRVTLDPGLAREGIRLFRELARSAEREVLLCTDLHAENVLAAQREPWLVIDPKPYVGDPTYDALQHMLNCEERLNDDPLGLAMRMADLLELDSGRLRLWLFARCVQESPGSEVLADVARRIAP
jgi:streptomycin 6-kinase